MQVNLGMQHSKEGRYMNNGKINVGICTFWPHFNFGTIMQACALQQVVRGMGYDAVHLTIDGEYPSISAPTSLRRLKSFVLLTSQHVSGRMQAFRDFVQTWLHLTSHDGYDDLKKHADDYDILICGSDQVWRYAEDFFLLNFAAHGRKMAYAPSLGLAGVEQSKREIFAQAWKEISFISCREKTGAAVIAEVTGRQVPVVLDPTLLLSREEWEEKETDCGIEEPFILCYFIHSTKRSMTAWRKSNPIEPCSYYDDVCKKMARESGYKTVFVCGEAEGKLGWNLTKQGGFGPDKILNLFHQAAMVITDSFHGTVFSIIYQKPFFTIPVKWKSGAADQQSRQKDLLASVGLQDRYLELNAPVPDWQEAVNVDFEAAMRKLQDMRTSSLEFLKSSLHALTAECNKGC